MEFLSLHSSFLGILGLRSDVITPSRFCSIDSVKKKWLLPLSQQAVVVSHLVHRLKLLHCPLLWRPACTQQLCCSQNSFIITSIYILCLICVSTSCRWRQIKFFELTWKTGEAGVSDHISEDRNSDERFPAFIDDFKQNTAAPQRVW